MFSSCPPGMRRIARTLRTGGPLRTIGIEVNGEARKDGPLFRRLAVPFLVVMARFGVGLGRLDDAVLMLGRAVERVQLEGRGAGVANIMTGAGRYDRGAAVLDRIAVVVDVDRAAAFLEAEELVAVLMDFGADLLAGLKGHQHELEMVSGVKHPAKIAIVRRQLLDIVMIALHGSSSF